MRDSTKHFIYCVAAMAAGVLVAAGERNAHSVSAMYSYIVMSVALLGLATCYAGMALMDLAEEEKLRKAKKQYIDRRHARSEEPEYRQTRRDA